MTSYVDYVPLAEYLFRYDRAGFWVGAQGWTYFKLVPFNKWTRWFLDDFIHTRMMYRALHASGESARFVVQDLALPYTTAEKFVDYTADKFGIWPLWLCPLKPTQQPTFHPHTGITEPAGTTAASPPASDVAAAASDVQPAPMLNIGVWGWGPSDFEEFVDKNIDLETKLQELGGRKWLYAHTYYPEEKFWNIYDKPWYTALREKYSATTLPTVYDKVKIDVQANRRKRQETRQSFKGKWPVGGLYGIWKAIQSGDYHLHRRAEWKYKEKS
ncbi:hypothetical protein NQ176_g11204 [Zarea fungicola]|uniref:Uncharacterized protein n=1 Tax=Zarea fungicola TaxID=93591 RepID=A0ACC1MDQ0_9HYPO|nr:hypothetical protein NQ176_g11204 [Lecanicillium fungicola]